MFVGKQAETRTQLSKLMFLTVVTEDHKIENYEPDFKTFNEKNKVLTKERGAGERVTAAMLIPARSSSRSSR